MRRSAMVARRCHARDYQQECLSPIRTMPRDALSDLKRFFSFLLFRLRPLIFAAALPAIFRSRARYQPLSLRADAAR